MQRWDFAITLGLSRKISKHKGKRTIECLHGKDSISFSEFVNLDSKTI